MNIAETAGLRPDSFVTEVEIDSLLSDGDGVAFGEAAERFRQVYERAPDIDIHLLASALRRGNGERLGRALRLLGTVSDGRRLVMSLMPLMRSSDSRIRSHAALLLARGSRSLAWVMEHLKDPDPRVRANVIEGVSAWMQDRAIFRKAARDPHHRVSGNALMALFRLGDPEAQDLLDRALSQSDWHFRAAALWAVGASGDLKLLAHAEKMRNDPHPAVRWNALRAMAALKRAAAEAAAPQKDADWPGDPAG